MEDKETKRRLKKIPDVDKNGDPIYKIDTSNESDKKIDVPSNREKKSDKN